MNKFIKHTAVVLAAALLATPAFAGQETFDLAWSGASFGNTATATGEITIDTDAINTGYNEIVFPDSRVTDLSITISGADAGNGTFGMSDFGFMVVWAPGPLDFSQQLVGQQQPGGTTWGVSDGNSGDFNIFGNNANAPVGTSYFVLTTADYSGDSMLLTSMTSAVPEAQNISMMLAGLGLVGFAARRRKARA